MERAAERGEHRFVRVAAPAGSGKTTLLRATVSTARAAGWLAISATCSAQADPLALLLDLTSAAYRELGDAAEAYASGLDRALSVLRPRMSGEPAASVERSFATVPPEIVMSRLLEGIAADRPILIAIDDAHAVATETVRAIRYVYTYLSGVPLCLVCAQRDDVPPHPDLPACSAELSLGPLEHADACAIVRSEYPGAPDGVLDAIVERAQGSPADLVLLASQARLDEARSASDVAGTLHAKILRELAALDDESRTFLQYCALIGAPVEERVLTALYPDAAVLARLIGGPARRYLVSRDGSFAFRHDAVPAAIRASVELELPLHRRIIAAFAGLDRGQLRDYQRIVEHAAAINDRDTCYDYTERIAQAAYALQRWEQSADAFAAALELRWPAPERYVSFFRRYATALRGATRDAEAEGVIVRALRHGAETGLAEGLGRLAATLVAIQTELEDPERAIATFERAIAGTQDAGEASELRAAVAATYAGIVDEERLRTVADEIATSGAATPIALASLHQSRALLHARLGEHDAARRALRIAESFSTSQQSGLDFSLPLIELFVDFQEHGCRALDVTAAAPAGATRGDAVIGYWHYLHLVSDLARGRWRDAESRLDQLNLERLPPVQQMLLLSVPSAMAALGEDRSGTAARARPFMDLASRRGIGPSGFQLAAWVLAAKHDPSPEFLTEIARQVRAFANRPLAIDLICFVPVALALYAVNEDHALAAEIAAQEVPRCSRWLHAQHAFARGYTAAKLGLGGGTALLDDAAERFKALGASFFADLASGCAISSRAKQTQRSRPAQRRTDGLTAREVQIAELVAAGKRNREIAQFLFLSERTVEVHLANTFLKLKLSSRTQLARYMMR
jgi:DNA-binding CsgD family transcriptional regulator/tetratricopeptide (TPR) repeat protein